MSFHLAWRNLVFEESHALTTTGTVVAGTLTSLRTPQLADRVTLSDTGTDTQLSIRIDDAPSVATGRRVQMLALLDIEFVLDGTFTDLQVRYDIGGTEPVIGEAFPLPTFDAGFPRNAYILLPVESDDVEITRLYIEADVVGTGTLTASIGAIWQGPALELPVGPLRLRHIEQARETTTPGGQRFGEDSVTLRELRFDVESMSQALAIGSDSTTQDVQQAIQYAGETGAVLAVPFVSDQHARTRLGVYGTMKPTGELVRRAAGVWQWSGPVITEMR